MAPDRRPTHSSKAEEPSHKHTEMTDLLHIALQPRDQRLHLRVHRLARPEAAQHLSWLVGGGGVLMLPCCCWWNMMWI
jgi:hypothetical protein